MLNIEDLLMQVHLLAKVFVDVASVIGLLIIVLSALKITYGLIQGFRLYVWSQICRKTDLVERYGKWAVISGATDGIGKSIAIELARRGHSIIVIGRNERKLADTKLIIEQEMKVEVITIKIDLSDSSIENFVKIRNQIEPETRDIGILVNNAGILCSYLVKYADIDMDCFRQTVNTNVLSTLYLTRLMMPGMLNRGRGLVLNISSAFSYTLSPCANVYGPTKTFINRFSQILQCEYSGEPIDIVYITPGPVETKLLAENMTYPKLLKQIGFVPEAGDFSRTVVNALATRIGHFSGTFWFGCLDQINICGDFLGLSFLGAAIWTKMVDYKLFPKPTKSV